MSTGRPDVLALPSSTALRAATLVAALVVAGLHVGTAVHNILFGAAWTAAARACLGPAELVAGAAAAACQAPAEGRRVLVALAAAGAVALAAAVVVLLVPGGLRRRHRLVPAGDRPAYRRAVAGTAELAAAAGVRVPQVLVGPGPVREPFCLGRPGAYAVVLPRKLALLGDPVLFGALLRHELAHLAHRDVAVSWLARSLGWVLAPLLAVPVVLSAARGEPLLALDQAWRSAVLLGVALLVQRALLRAREFDADLRAARAPGAGPALHAHLAAVAPRQATSGPARWLERLRAVHPPPQDRCAVLREPARATALGLADGLALAFLAALTLPLVTAPAAAAGLAATVPGLAALVGALVVGSLFGAAVGTGLWREAVVARAVGSTGSTRRVAVGVLLGGVLGRVASLAGVGLPGPGGLAHPALVLVVPLAMAGVTVLVGGLGELWANGAGRTGSPAAVAVPAVVLGAVAAVAAVWGAQVVEFALEQGGWAFAALVLTTPGALVLPGATAVLLAAAALGAVWPRGAAAPAWLVGRAVPVAAAGPARAAVAGLAVGAGLAAGAALAWVRVVAGPAPDDLDAVQRVDAAVLASALVAVGLGLVLAAGWGPAGAGAAVVAGPVAALVTGTVFLGQVALLGGNPLAFAGPVLFGGVAAAAVLTPPALLAGALPGTRFGPMVASVLVVTLAAGTAGLVMVGRDVAVPGLAGVVPGRTELAPPGPAPVPPAAAVGPELYGATVAPVLAERRTAVSATVRDLVATAGSDVAFADGLRRDVVPPLRDALLAAEAVRVDDPGLRAVHDEALAALRLEVAGYGDLVAAIDAGDVARAEEAQRVIGSADPHWERWALGVPS